MTRAEKPDYMEDLASPAQEATNRVEQGQANRSPSTEGHQHADKQGRLFTIEAEKEAKWAEHVSEGLNRPPSIIEAEVQDPDTDLDVRERRNYGRNEIPQKWKSACQESLNTEPEFAAQVLQRILAAIWEEKRDDSKEQHTEQLQQLERSHA